ncbi:hypothetical protein, partial [Haladaptatus sp. W1]|uniref:hypothetical protein n=1 Tax=Haladaptatus sp. W1 TaxID=1897478 RepID=UPI001C30601D
VCHWRVAFGYFFSNSFFNHAPGDELGASTSALYVATFSVPLNSVCAVVVAVGSPVEPVPPEPASSEFPRQPASPTSPVALAVRKLL